MGYGESVPAIASFNEKGEILPLYFKIDGVQLKVLHAKLVSNVSGHMEFACAVEDQGYEKQLRISYISGDHIWKRIV